jgi:heme-degrading monooxygenase HmoA
MSTIDSTCTTKVPPNNLGEAAGYTGKGLGVTNDAIESQNHARKPLANAWLPRPQRRLRCAALYLLLKSYWWVVPFFAYTRQVVTQLETSDGLLGYSLLARPLSKRFWTLSVWKNEDALRAFVQHLPHVRITSALAPHMDKTRFVRWTVKGSDLPLRWDDALQRLPL